MAQFRLQPDREVGRQSQQTLRLRGHISAEMRGKGCGMRSTTIIAVALVAYGLSACVSMLAPKPPDPQRSHIGIAIRVWATIPFLPGAISQVYFARLEENQQDLLSLVPLLASNCNFPPNVLNFKGTYYLLNAEPGRYAVVVAFQRGGRRQSSGGAM